MMTDTQQTGLHDSHQNQKPVKCLVWDLDNTLWTGVLLEDRQVSLRPDAARVIKTLDERGILQSIASKNNFDDAMAQLRQFGLDQYFLYPQIGWGSKAAAIKQIAQTLNIGLDTLAFIDDQPFERDEVCFAWPEVRCLDATHLSELPELPALTPPFVTPDARLRRSMYQAEQVRGQAEAEFSGPQEAFLASLEMTLNIFPGRQSDLQRAEELTVRTNQLNSTARTYSGAELDQLWQSDRHQLLMARLTDKYGPYGHIGLALVACAETVWTIKLLLMSCRVMSRGTGTVMLTHIMRQAATAGVRLQAEFIPNDRNRMMNITFRLAGFEEVDRRDELIIFENSLACVPPFPDYMTIQVD